MPSSARGRLGFAFVVSALAASLLLVGCPASEDDPPLCNGGVCGPGICLQYCGNDAATDNNSVDAAKEAAIDGANADASADANADASTDANEGG
ncbi:hypothetical protein BH09MYX1_BH09MYX1_36240 [soil metagenome]